MPLPDDAIIQDVRTILLPRSATSHEREQIEAYLTHQFGIGWVLPQGHPGHVPALWFWEMP